MDNKLEKVSLFANLRSYGSKTVGLEEIVRLIRYDNFVRQKSETYRQLARTITRKEANRRIKDERMEACSVGVLFNGTGRQPEHVERCTGLALCDMDHISAAQLEEARRKIPFDQIQPLLAADAYEEAKNVEPSPPPPVQDLPF